MLTQTPKPSAQAVVWAMKQQRESTATMVRNVEAPHQHLSVWRDASKMKLKILEWEALLRLRPGRAPTRQSWSFEKWKCFRSRKTDEQFENEKILWLDVHAFMPAAKSPRTVRLILQCDCTWKPPYFTAWLYVDQRSTWRWSLSTRLFISWLRGKGTSSNSTLR